MKTQRGEGEIIVSIVVVILLLVFLVFPFVQSSARNEGITQGRIEVASGQVKCTLTPRLDKTTEWVCVKDKP